MKRQLIWLRSDLRIDDNSALAAAAAKGPVIAVFLRSIPQWQKHGHGANKLDFWGRGVAALKTALNGLNIPLLHRDIERYDQAPAVLLEIAREHDVEQLHFNHEYALNEQRRDQAAQDAFKQAGIVSHGYHDSVAFAPGSLLTGKGSYYSVFTPFSNAWHKNITADQLTLRDTPSVQAKLAINSDPLPSLPKLDETPVDGRLWPADENAAADNLSRFLRFRGRHYKAQRDLPKVRGTSELSPYLALGMISHRQCLQAVMAENSGHLGDGDLGLTTWVNELIWREFYQHVAVGFPQVCRYQPFQEHTKQLAWRDDEGFQA